MSCKSCGSDAYTRFPSEIAIHFRGQKGVDELPVFVFPKLLVCFHCGHAEFAIPEHELRLLKGDVPARSGAPSG